MQYLSLEMKPTLWIQEYYGGADCHIQVYVKTLNSF